MTTTTTMAGMTADEKLDAILAEVHDLRRQVAKLSAPLSRLTRCQVAERLGRSASTVERLDARGVFSDARDHDKRVAGSSRLYYADEVAAYLEGGEAEVRRVRDLMAR